MLYHVAPGWLAAALPVVHVQWAGRIRFPRHQIYVAADLRHYVHDPLWSRHGRDVVSDGAVHRRMDLVWYGAIQQQVAQRQAQARQGRIPADEWSTTKQRFTAIWRHARARWTQAQLTWAETNRRGIEPLPTNRRAA